MTSQAPAVLFDVDGERERPRLIVRVYPISTGNPPYSGVSVTVDSDWG
jgi:hypothetical protein